MAIKVYYTLYPKGDKMRKVDSRIKAISIRDLHIIVINIISIILILILVTSITGMTIILFGTNTITSTKSNLGLPIEIIYTNKRLNVFELERIRQISDNFIYKVCGLGSLSGAYKDIDIDQRYIDNITHKHYTPEDFIIDIQVQDIIKMICKTKDNRITYEISINKYKIKEIIERENNKVIPELSIVEKSKVYSQEIIKVIQGEQDYTPRGSSIDMKIRSIINEFIWDKYKNYIKPKIATGLELNLSNIDIKNQSDGQHICKLTYRGKDSTIIEIYNTLNKRNKLTDINVQILKA